MRGSAGAATELVGVKSANLANQSEPCDRGSVIERQRETPPAFLPVASIHPLQLSSDAYLKCC